MTPDDRFAARLRQLLDTDPRDLCGLIDDYGESADDDASRASALYLAVGSAAEHGARPTRRVTTPPGWIAGAGARLLADVARGRGRPGTFLVVRALEHGGVLDLDTTGDYLATFVDDLGRDLDGTPTSRARALRQDPALVERCLWPMFTAPDVDLASTDTGSTAPWRAVLIDLVADGLVEREEVFDRCLDALDEADADARASWYTGLFAGLHPTTRDLATRQDRLVDLVSSKATPTVSFAVAQLVAVDASGLLDDEVLVRGVGPALTASGKTTALGGLRLLAACARRRPDLSPRIADAVHDGLDRLHPDIRQHAVALLARTSPSDPRTAAMDPSGSPPTASGTRAPASPRLPPPCVVVALGPDQLPAILAEVLEDPSDPIILEQVLDALTRVEDPAPIAPLAPRARAALDRADRDGEAHSGLSPRIAAMILGALGEEVRPPDGDPLHHPPSPPAFLTARLDEVGATLRGAARPGLLALPTTWPWIDADALVDRLLDTAARGRPPLHHDLVAALLRLHPEGREDALERWERDDTGGECHAVVRYALGGALDPAAASASVGNGTRGWWIAAARSRSPRGLDEGLTDAGIVGNGADRPLTIEVRVDTHRARDAVDDVLTLDVGTTLPDIGSDEPTAVHANASATPRWRALPDREPWAYDQGFAAWWPWWASTFPHDADHLAADAILPLAFATHFDWTHRGAGPAVEALRGHPGHWGPAAALAVALGIGAEPTDTRAVAADALRGALDEGLLTTDRVVDAMVLVHPIVATGSWGDALARVSAAGPAARLDVLSVLTGLLPRLDPTAPGLTALVRRLSEESSRADRPVTDRAFAAWAEALPRDSWAGRTARALARGFLDPTFG